MIIGLKDRGVDVEVMTHADCEYARRMQSKGIVVHDYVPERKFSASAIKKIRSVLKTGRHDIVQLFNNKAIVAGARAARGLPVKVVTYRGQTGNISRFDPVCYLTHLSPRVDAIVCVANAVRDSLRRELRNPEKALTIYKGHDADWYRDVRPLELSELGVPPSAFTVVCVANDRPRKGIPVLIEAARQLPPELPIHFALIGSGMDSQQIRKKIGDENLQARCHRFGYRDDVLQIVSACDVAVLPAIKREGLPKTVIEAMVLGVPPIVTATGGSPELVEHGRCGLVVTPGDPDSLAAAILDLYQNSERRQAMGAAARARIAENFTLTRSIDEHLQLFRSLLS
ncbi:MAG: glycosyltransferase family 4 protein [Gammaproteobacteria bacterium]|nr:glycosyltransferase family 4 protein [Gammaproteobacteria bacterium]